MIIITINLLYQADFSSKDMLVYTSFVFLFDI